MNRMFFGGVADLGVDNEHGNGNRRTGRTLM